MFDTVELIIEVFLMVDVSMSVVVVVRISVVAPLLTHLV
jgi:hypothetical protein